jgi:hypothetical protein
MAEKYKSVLEKHNENRTHRVPTAEEEAIEPVYPEEYLVGGPGKAVASSFMGSGKQAAKDAARYRIAQTRIGERAIDIEADKAAREAFAKTKPGKATYESLRKQEEQAAKNKSVNQAKDIVKQSTGRASKNFSGEAGTLIGNEMYRQNENAAGDTYKKGGKVKSTASSRGDGIASRGKTRGKLV